jgi:acyl carrier protein
MSDILTTTQSRVIANIYEVIDEMNAVAPKAKQIQKFPTTPLFGLGGNLDSLALVTFIVALEQKLEAAFGTSIALADEEALAHPDAVFASVRSVAEHATRLLLPAGSLAADRTGGNDEAAGSRLG